MTVADAIALVDEIKPNAFSDAVKIRWLGQLDGRAACEVLLMDATELGQFDYAALTEEAAKAKTLLIDPPHDGLYVDWLAAQIDYCNGEYTKYQNTKQVFNERWDEFVAWFAGTYRPADGFYFSELTEGGAGNGDV